MRLVLLVAIFIGPALIGLLASPLPTATAHHFAPVQPGAQVAGLCTYNFVFEDADHRYIGAAGHCIGGLGARAITPGLGEFGTVVYHRNDATNFTEPGNQTGPLMDFALIQIDEDKRDVSVPDMRHWGGPTRVADDFTPGQATLHYGQGLYWHIIGGIRPRPGVLIEVYDDGPFRDWYLIDHVVLGGDSGSGILLDDGSALGVISTVAATFGAQPGVVGGPTVGLILELLHEAGWDVELVPAAYRDVRDPTDAGFMAYQMSNHCWPDEDLVASHARQDGCVRPAYYRYRTITADRPEREWSGTSIWQAQAVSDPRACVLGEWFVTLWERPCDEQVLIVQIPDDFWDGRNGNLALNITWDGSDDELDLYVYDSTNTLVASSADRGVQFDTVTIPNPPPGEHYRVVVTPVMATETNFRTQARLTWDTPWQAEVRPPSGASDEQENGTPLGAALVLLGVVSAGLLRRRV